MFLQASNSHANLPVLSWIPREILKLSSIASSRFSWVNKRIWVNGLYQFCPEIPTFCEWIIGSLQLLGPNWWINTGICSLFLARSCKEPIINPQSGYFYVEQKWLSDIGHSTDFLLTQILKKQPNNARQILKWCCPFFSVYTHDCNHLLDSDVPTIY